jgi:TRAP-type C4-dicarboxylate transport system substrate-binding protein
MNRAKWDSLTIGEQNIIDTMSDEYAVKLSKLWDQKDKNTIRKMRAKNHCFILLSREEEKRWEKFITFLYESLVEEKSANGLAAADALSFCKTWVQRNVR